MTPPSSRQLAGLGPVRVNHDEVTEYRMAKQGAVADEPWAGDLVAEVGGKIFAFLGGGWLGVRCGATAEWRHQLPGHPSR